MTRKQELEEVKQIIKEYYNHADCGLYNTRNIASDYMINIYDGKYFTVDICFYYSYFEVFGATSEEFEEISEFYDNLQRS